MLSLIEMKSFLTKISGLGKKKMGLCQDFFLFIQVRSERVDDSEDEESGHEAEETRNTRSQVCTFLYVIPTHNSYIIFYP